MATGHSTAERAVGLRPPRAEPPARPVLQVNGRTVRVLGSWTLKELAPQLAALRRELSRCSDRSLRWDLRSVKGLDSGGALLLWRSWGGELPDEIIVPTPLRERIEEWAQVDPASVDRHRRSTGLLELAVGHGRAVLSHIVDGVVLLGRLVLDLIHLARHPSEVPWREISATIYSAGTRAMWVTALVGLLIGIVVSYLASEQLLALGAPGYIVKIVGISVLRELSPLLTAVLVAGRSGAAMTAELGVMRLAREVDALDVMGVSISRRLLLPKVAALLVVGPLLVVWTDAMAVLGGMIAAHHTLGIALYQFAAALPQEVPVENLWLGVAKGGVFGVLVALTACHMGLRVEPSARSLGRETTTSVVVAITSVILANAVFAVLFREVGIR